jgi:lysophospholipase L1-like esterase
MTMYQPILTGTLVTLVWCGALVVVGRNKPSAPDTEDWKGLLQGAVRALHDRDLNRETDDAEVAGYYEGLLAGRPRTLLGRSRDAANYRFRRDFLYYEARENVDWPEHDGSGRHVTNSRGMTDREYPVERTVGARRIAVIGDSVARGQGAPTGESFEALLENRLNEAHTSDEVRGYELLNFATTGYRLTQMVDVAVEKVPVYKPDVYLVCLTRLSVAGAWGDHMAQLIYDGIDLKYPYLKQLANDAGLDPRDPIGTMRAKLAASRIPTIHWGLRHIRDLARQEGAEMIVVFVPTANSPESLEPGFAAIRKVVAELDVPLIDLLPVFAEEDLATVKVRPGNVHPNGKGHRLIFEYLYRTIQSDGVVRDLMFGPRTAASVAPAPSSTR